MKKIVSGNELQEKMSVAVNLLCDTVKTTLGPKGSNVIIDHSSFSPFITNDGVTIASNIESDDETINTILELTKEASIKTNEVVGDGTTTTLVLLQSFFNEGLKLIKNGKNPIILKKELEKIKNKVIENILKESKKPTKEEILNIACISANDKTIGKLVSDAFIKTKNKDAIEIIEHEEPETFIKVFKGYSFETLFASPYFLNDKKEINLKNSYILIVNDNINVLEEIEEVLNEVIKNNLSLVIISNDYDDYFINQIVSLNMNNNFKIILLKSPEYGIRQKTILSDISLITNANVVNDISRVLLNDLGFIKNIKLTNELTTITFSQNKLIKEKIKELKQDTNLDIDFKNKRIAMFTTNLVKIYVGAPTSLERREKKMRFDDALCACNSAIDGILPGGGVTLLKVSDFLTETIDTEKIFKLALKQPFFDILNNSGLDSNKILNNIRNSNFNTIFNVISDNFENINNTTIIDPTSVVINSLINSISIASILLTTSSLIINEYKNISNTTDYSLL